MLKFTNIQVKEIVAHQVGNKNRNEKCFTSGGSLLLDENLEATLTKYFLKPFRQISETYRFVHSTDMSYHLMNGISQKIFLNNDDFYSNTIEILNHLYNQSNHPQIKNGDLFLVLFDDILIEDELVQAVGIFKSERKDAFIKLSTQQNQIVINQEEGISLKKIDKGCLILNLFGDEGYRVFSFDNNDYDANYWKNSFLGIDYVQDKNYDTRSYIDMCRGFADEVIKEKSGKKDQLEFLSDSINYFDFNEKINVEEFKETLFETDDQLKEDFSNYKKQYEEDFNVAIPMEIPISRVVVQKQKKAIKNFIKLDTGIQVKLDFKDPESTKKFVEKGFDPDKGMHFYKVFYNEELN